jgi:pilus assembly protein Flp/PilA
MLTKFCVRAQVAGAHVRARVAEILSDRKGVTAMEYGIIAAVTVVVVGAAMSGIGVSLGTIWTAIGTALSTAA